MPALSGVEGSRCSSETWESLPSHSTGTTHRTVPKPWRRGCFERARLYAAPLNATKPAPASAAEGLSRLPNRKFHLPMDMIYFGAFLADNLHQDSSPTFSQEGNCCSGACKVATH